MAKFSFHREFQIQVLSLLFNDYDFLLLGHEIIKPEYFCDHVLIWYFEAIRDYYLDYQIKMDKDALRNEIKKAVDAKEIQKKDFESYLKVYTKILIIPPNGPYIQDQIITFCRHQEVRKAVLEVPKLLEKNNFESIAEILGNALMVGQAKGDLGMRYFKTHKQRISERATRGDERIYPTGITPLDDVIGGGLKPGQMGIWMAPTGRGKSLALVHCGKRTVIYRQNVIYYSFELDDQEVAERYDSSFSGIKVKELIDKEAQLAKKLDILGQQMNDNLIIKTFAAKSASVETIRSHIKQCIASGWYPNLILIDYLDLLKAPYRRNKKREELSDISEAIKSLLMDYKIPGWTATQSRRGAVSKETHGEDDVAEDWGKLFPADVVATINQTNEEANLDTLRLFIGKNRNGPRGVTVGPINVDFARMVFFIADREDPNAGAANNPKPKLPGKPPKIKPGKSQIKTEIRI